MRLLSIKSIVILLTIATSTFTAIASVSSYTKDADGVTITLDKGVMKIKVCSNDIIEVKYTSLSALASKNSLVINNQWKTTISFEVSEKNGEIVISTNRLKVKVNKQTNAITYTDLKDAVILAEDANAGKQVEAATVAGINTYNCATLFNSPSDEALFGLGCHPEDSLAINYKGRNQDLAIKYMTGAIPVLLSTKGYGILWDNYSASNFYGSEANNTK
jgi:alpha-D-xyloside xylohydrolase